MKVFVGITGASDTCLGLKLIERLTHAGIEVIVAITDVGQEVCRYEVHEEFTKCRELKGVKIIDNKNLFESVCSGSFLLDAMVICPCSMGVVGRIANGISSTVIERAADVMLKERRKLVLVPRETPYNMIHLNNMTTLIQCGAIIMPPNMSFYLEVNTVEDLIQHFISRVMDQLGIIDENASRWGDM